MTITRIIMAGFAGAATGAFLFAAIGLVEDFLIHNFRYVLKYGLRNFFMIFVWAGIVWLIGLFVLGGPFWLLLHRLNKRGWMSAVLLGLLLTFFIALLIATRGFGLSFMSSGGYSASDSGGRIWINGVLTSYGWVRALWGALLFSVSGAIAGLVTWWVAYRPSH